MNIGGSEQSDSCVYRAKSSRSREVRAQVAQVGAAMTKAAGRRVLPARGRFPGLSSPPPPAPDSSRHGDRQRLLLRVLPRLDVRAPSESTDARGR
jgi:hypothetical protein